MSRPRTLCDLDWRTVRMITIDGLRVSMLEEEQEFSFEFATQNELQSALKHWASGEPDHHTPGAHPPAPASVTMTTA